jgi:release factor glutamine methyltransferase
MKLSEIKILFQTELSELYSKSEIEELFSIFCESFLELNKIELRHNLDKDLSEIDSKKFSEAISELKTGKPFQQILGETEFYGMKFFVNEHVLIPRPETEELLELAIRKIQEKSKKNQVFDSSQLERLREPQPDNNQPTINNHFRILDIGTGSGIIPIVLKKNFPEAEVTSIDISKYALEIAKRNAEFHKVEINFMNKDYLNEVFGSAQTDNEVFDVIISNPPYIGIEENPEIEDSVKGFEPNIALFSPTSDALVFYRKIAEDSRNHLAENGMIFLEINQKLGKETLELFQGFSEFILLKDISGNDRIVFARK